MVGAKSEIKLLRKLDHVAQVFPRSPRTLVAITSISVVFHLVQIMLHSVMAWGLGAYIPFQHLLVVIPLVNIAGSLPISWNGLGVRENAYVFFLTPALISKEQAVAFGAIWLLAMTVCSAIGGVIAFTSGDLKFLRQKKKELGNTDALEAAITTEQKAA